jgi:hypothetical protein
MGYAATYANPIYTGGRGHGRGPLRPNPGTQSGVQRALRESTWKKNRCTSADLPACHEAASQQPNPSNAGPVSIT